MCVCCAGVDFKVKFVELEGQRVKLTIWDTAGQERFRTLTSSYYRGAQGVILVYDVTSRESFDNLQSVWLKELETYSDLSTVVLMIVGNKIDKDQQRKVTLEEGRQWAKKLSAMFMECSAKTRVGVITAFEDLAHRILNAPSRSSSTDASAAAIRIDASPTGEGDGCLC